MGNRKAVTDRTFWQPWLKKNVPMAGALLFGVLLAALTVWFTDGALGPWVVFASFCVALLLVGLLSEAGLRFVLPLLLALAALALLLSSGGFSGPAMSAVLWPVLGMAALGNPNSSSNRGTWFGASLAACLGTMMSLAVLERLIVLPVSASVAMPSAICAIGACGAFTLAALVHARRQSRDQGTLSARDVLHLTQGRDAALLEADRVRSQSQERAQFMAEMSHEIRTPLNAILGFADTMRSQIFGPLPKPYGDYPDLIHKSGSHLLDIVSDLLDLSKIEAGRYDTKIGPISLDALAQESVRLASGSARSAGVVVREDIEQPIRVQGDARAVRQIIFNLVSNGIKFTPAGGHVIVRVKRGSHPDTAFLEIEDNGMGMSEADLARIGQPWNQIGEAVRDQSGKRTRGSGLGLALVKRLAELQGADFDLKSDLGAGTRARVSFKTV